MEIDCVPIWVWASSAKLLHFRLSGMFVLNPELFCGHGKVLFFSNLEYMVHKMEAEV